MSFKTVGVRTVTYTDKAYYIGFTLIGIYSGSVD